MAQASEIKASARPRAGKGGARAVRRQGRVPGVLYGEGAAAQNIDLDFKDLLLAVGRGKFLSTGADETDTWPLPMGGQDLVEWDGGLKPAAWDDLGVSLDRQGLHCTYVAIAGEAEDDTNIGAKAIEFGFTVAPSNNWYYLLAECDFDGRPTNSFYFQAFNSDRIIKENDGS